MKKYSGDEQNLRTAIYLASMWPSGAIYLSRNSISKSKLIKETINTKINQKTQDTKNNRKKYLSYPTI